MGINMNRHQYGISEIKEGTEVVIFNRAPQRLMPSMFFEIDVSVYYLCGVPCPCPCRCYISSTPTYPSEPVAISVPTQSKTLTNLHYKHIYTYIHQYKE